MGVEIKLVEWSVRNYLIEKINFNTKVKHGTFIDLTCFMQPLSFFVFASMVVFRVVLATVLDSV